MIKVQNIYYMLAYAFKVLNSQGYKKLAVENFSHTGELMAAILRQSIFPCLWIAIMVNFAHEHRQRTAESILYILLATLCLIHHFPIDEGSQTLSLLYVLEIVLQEVAVKYGQIG